MMSSELKTYDEWKSRYEAENDCFIHDDDGGRALEKLGKLNERITYGEALQYLLVCTILSKSR